jgi:hypothetical protein
VVHLLKRIKPKTTVGKPIRVLNIVFITILPRKFLRAINIASGSPQSVAKIIAVPEKRRERETIP